MLNYTMKKRIILCTFLLSFASLGFSQTNTYKTLGFTSKLHEKSVGKILFAKKMDYLARGAEQENNTSTSFTFGEEIYFRVYMDNSLANYILNAHPEISKSNVDNNSYYTVYFSFDGTEKKKFKISKTAFENEDKHEWTSFKGALNKGNNPGDPLLWGEFKNYIIELDGKLSNGTHTIKVEVHPCIDNPEPIELATVASGELTYIVNANSIDKNDQAFCLQKANMKDPVIEAKVLKAFATDKGNLECKAKFARIISKEWEITRNDLTGRILRRHLVLIVVATNKEGKYFYKNCYISQEYIGGKFTDKINFTCDDNETRVNSRCIE